MAVAVGPLNVELTLWNLVCHLAPLSASNIKMRFHTVKKTPKSSANHLLKIKIKN
jgi:hypothetical protein